VTTGADDDAVTLGEVNRNVTAMRLDLRELARDVVELKVAADRVQRLERIVYGASATAAAGLITAVVGMVTGRG
jgi:hypothetical protein